MKKLLFLPIIVFMLGIFVLSSFSVSAHAATISASPKTATHISTAVQPLSCPPTLSEGSSGPWVGVLQRELNELYLDFDDSRYFENYPNDFHPLLAVDQSFGPLTFNAVIDYQSWNYPLSVDGVVGPHTWHSLGNC